MRLRCRKRERRRTGGIFSLTTLSALTVATFLGAPGQCAPAAADADSTNAATATMSERIRKYTGEDEAQSSGVKPSPERLQKVRDRIMQMPPEQREKVLQQIKERRSLRRSGSAGGASAPGGSPLGGGSGGIPPGFPGGPPGGPEFGPEGGGRPPGVPDGMGMGMGMDDEVPLPPPNRGSGGFGRDRMRGPASDFRPGPRGGAGGAPLKSGKFFGREPLDLTVLNLTPEQKTRIQTMRAANGKKARAIRADLKVRRDQFRDMLFDPAATNEQIVETRKAVNKLQTQAEDLMLNDFLGIRKLLTKEQLELLPQVRPEPPVRRNAFKSTKRKTTSPKDEVSERTDYKQK